MNFENEAYEHAIEVIASCAKPNGFFASGLPGGYEATWARDSMITSLGACLVSNQFKSPFGKSLDLLSKNQSKLGQIPNAVGTYNTDRRSDVTYNSIDSTLWYLIGHYLYAKSYDDQELLNKYHQNIKQAFLWLSYQDPDEDKLLVQLPTMDWQDAFPHKYGRVINSEALYYGTLTMHNKLHLAQYLKKIVNGEIQKYLSLYNKKLGFYLPWVWKNHDGLREQEEWFDSLGNLLAIVTGLATHEIANNILAHIEKEKIDTPFPCKAIYPPIKKGDRQWHDYFTHADSKTAYNYLNAGVWPFIGGFYVAALVKTGKQEKAKSALKKLAQANYLGIKRKWEFNEWLHGTSGKPLGTPYQGWSAGAYVFAYESVRKNKVPFFD